jgi:hypothetical protein
MINIPPWVYTLLGAVAAAVGYLSQPANLALMPASWATVITTIGVVIGVIGQLLHQFQGHAAIVASTNAVEASTAITNSKVST